MEQNKNDVYPVHYLVYNFTLIALATYLVAFHDWSLWTYVGFLLFMVSKSD
jgi:hypothetical protein